MNEVSDLILQAEKLAELYPANGTDLMRAVTAFKAKFGVDAATSKTDFSGRSQGMEKFIRSIKLPK